MTTKFSELSEDNMDANSTATVSQALDMKENAFVSWTVQAVSGTHTTHVLTLQCSLDNSTWHSLASTITGVGLEDSIQVTARFVRAKVTTAEGAASVVDVIIQAK